MPDEYERLRKRIEDGLKAADELERRLAVAEREKRKKRFRVIKGGAVGGAIWAGVEWLLNPRKIALSVAASGLVITGATISDQPGSPSSDPPEATNPPASVSPSVTPTVKPTPRPPRTSPLRTLGRSSTPVAAPTTPRKPIPSRTKTPRPTPSKTPIATPIKTPSLTQTVVPTSAVETPKLTAPVTTCVVDLLGVELCLPLG